MHCSYFGQILQTVWPHPVIEVSGKNRLVMFISITDGALSFSLSQVQKLSWYSNEIIYHCEEKSILYNFLFRQWWNKSVKTFIYYCIRVIFCPSTLTVSPCLTFTQTQGQKGWKYNEGQNFPAYSMYFTCYLIKICMLAYRRYFKNTERTAMLQTSLEIWLIIMGCCSCQLKNWSLVMLSLLPSNVIKGIPSNQDRKLEMVNF